MYVYINMLICRNGPIGELETRPAQVHCLYQNWQLHKTMRLHFKSDVSKSLF